MRRVRALAAGLLLLALLAAVPAGLAGTIGNPTGALPDLLAGDLSDTALIGLLAGVAWAGWAQFAVATVVELVSAVRAAPMPRPIPGVLTGQQQLARVAGHRGAPARAGHDRRAHAARAHDPARPGRPGSASARR